MTQQEITIAELLKAGIHFGHRKSYWHPKMAPYIFGEREGLHIINLEATLPLLKQALEYVYNVANKGGRILFVGTKATAREIIREQAARCGMPYVDHRWLGGMLTNYKTIRRSIRRLKDLESMSERDEFGGLTKKERLTLMREKEKLDRSLGGIKDMGGLPEALFVVDTGFERIAVEEARRLSIPVVGVVDTNQDPTKVDYPIPGNDDAFRAIEFYASHVADTILQAREAIEKAMAGEEKAEAPEGEEGKRRRVVTKKLSLKRTATQKPAEEEEAKSTEAAETGAQTESAEAETTEAEEQPSESKESGAESADKKKKKPAKKKTTTQKQKTKETKSSEDQSKEGSEAQKKPEKDQDQGEDASETDDQPSNETSKRESGNSS